MKRTFIFFTILVLGSGVLADSALAFTKPPGSTPTLAQGVTTSTTPPPAQEVSSKG